MIHNFKEAFTAYREHGAASGVDPIYLMTHIADALHRRHDPSYLGAPLRWYAHTLGEWVELALSPAFDSLPLTTRRAIIRHLLRADLYPYHPSPALLKERLKQALGNLVIGVIG